MQNLSQATEDGRQAGFDYSGLRPDLAALLKSSANSIKTHIGQQTRSILETGVILLDAKSRLGHGLFTRWVQQEIGCTLRTAENYMRTATLFSGKSEIVSHLPPTTVYALAAVSTPPEVRTTVIAALESGKDIDAQAIESEIRAARGEKPASNKTEMDLAAQTSVLRKVASILREALTDEAYRDVCSLLTCRAVLKNPAMLVRTLKDTFANN